MRVMRDLQCSVETELPADDLAVAHVPLVVTNGTPLAQVQNFHVALFEKNNKNYKLLEQGTFGPFDRAHYQKYYARV